MAGMMQDLLWARLAERLSEPANPEERQNALQDRGDTQENNQELEQIGQPAVSHIFLDNPEQDGADYDDDKDVDER
jgi:hypothetical protein